MIKRILLAVVGLLQVANGTCMLAGSRAWFAAVAADTGAFNAHFVHDVGAAFIVSGLALLACSWRPRYWPVGLTGAAFLCAHGLIHLAGMFAGHPHNVVRDTVAIVIPAVVALWALWPKTEEEVHA